MTLAELKGKLVIIKTEVQEWASEELINPDMAGEVALMIIQDCIKKEHIDIEV